MWAVTQWIPGNRTNIKPRTMVPWQFLMNGYDGIAVCLDPPECPNKFPSHPEKAKTGIHNISSKGKLVGYTVMWTLLWASVQGSISWIPVASGCTKMISNSDTRPGTWDLGPGTWTWTWDGSHQRKCEMISIYTEGAPNAYLGPQGLFIVEAKGNGKFEKSYQRSLLWGTSQWQAGP